MRGRTARDRQRRWLFGDPALLEERGREVKRGGNNLHLPFFTFALGVLVICSLLSPHSKQQSLSGTRIGRTCRRGCITRSDSEDSPNDNLPYKERGGEGTERDAATLRLSCVRVFYPPS